MSIDSNTSILTINSNESELGGGKTATIITINDAHYGGSSTYFKVNLIDKNKNALKNQKISLTINGKTYEGTTDDSGVALIKATSLSKGSYAAKVKFEGNNKYSASSLSKNVKVLSSLKGNSLTKYYGTSKKYSAKFWKDNKALANAKVSLKVNGKTYYVKTNNKGVATLVINLYPGKYLMTVTNLYSGEKINNNIVVKKDSSKINAKAKTYITPKKKYSYSVTLLSKHNTPISGQKVYFKYNNKQVTAKTNKDGKATITIPALSKGTYSIQFNFKGNKGFHKVYGYGKIYVKDSSSVFKASNLKMQYKDGSKFSVKLKNKNGKVLTNKVVKITLNGKTTNCKTNNKGVAKLAIGDLKPGTYNIKYSYSSIGSNNYKTGSNKVIISKQVGSILTNNLEMNHGNGSVYKATIKDKYGNLLKKTGVQFKINGKTYNVKTDSKGVATLNINLGVGYYTITSKINDNYYQSKTISKHVLVNGIKFIAKDLYITVGNKAIYSIKLVDGKNNPIKNSAVVFTFNNKNYAVKTDSNGVAKSSWSGLSLGDYIVKYKCGKFSGSSKIHVFNKVSISNIIAASKNVKKFIERNKKLPKTVKVGGINLPNAEYTYLVSKAIVNLKKGNKNPIALKSISNPTKPGSSANMGNLVNYLSVAKSIVKTAESKGIMPNSVGSNVGNIGYDGLVYAFSRVVAFYGDNSRMPSYVSVNVIDSSSNSNVNSKNTFDDLKKFLAASKNCQVNSPKIKALVTKLTKGLKTNKQKATAIYNYVRDKISYSFYYDTKYGAVGTLNKKAGNCVDHSHLLVAMFRNAGIAARYVHGKCTFSSGNTYGHVWTQVLIGDTWTACDATSSRNSFGKIVNWNTKNYKLNGYYSSISF